MQKTEPLATRFYPNDPCPLCWREPAFMTEFPHVLSSREEGPVKTAARGTVPTKAPSLLETDEAGPAPVLSPVPPVTAPVSLKRVMETALLAWPWEAPGCLSSTPRDGALCERLAR